MKKYLIASEICIIPIMLFSVVNPSVYLINTKGGVLNETTLWVYIGILVLSLSIVMTTLFLLIPYASKIDKLDKAEIENNKEKERLSILISKYNKLISEV